ncbi:MAG: RluA family pseudouridine synthase [Proteobacteria bacterium]|jgi:23S rRNA pseudouridine1911/1915/1917 synthase|nr:RluA family pseudouridine synthase [Pseudomonadota bacterium]
MNDPKKPPRLDAVVRERFSLSWGRARDRIRAGKISVDGRVTLDIGTEIPEGAAIDFTPDARRPRPEDALLPTSAIVHLDNDIVVVDKPSGLLTVPYEPGDRPTLDVLLRAVLFKRSKRESASAGRRSAFVHVVHRLDRNTSGLLVFARNGAALARLKEQFKLHSAERRYLALVHGELSPRTFVSHLVQDRGDGLRGSVERTPRWIKPRTKTGKTAVTHVEVLERLGAATLISCRLETGRTNQIRIHLSEAGHPIVGETMYLRDYAGPVLAAPRLMLHAAELGFVHPGSGALVRFSSPVPGEMAAFLDVLRSGNCRMGDRPVAPTAP